MKWILLLFLTQTITLNANPSAPLPTVPYACTSFAVYSAETWYGMNFDYPEVELRFTLNRAGELKLFQMEFRQGDGFVPTVGMNSAGLFASCQMLYPEVEYR